MRFNQELYSKTALLKASYNYLEYAYIHLDMDEKYYYVFIKEKTDEVTINKDQFESEMLTQSIRHEVYLQTKNIRELLYARSMATSVIVDERNEHSEDTYLDQPKFVADGILKDWFEEND